MEYTTPLLFLLFRLASSRYFDVPLLKQYLRRRIAEIWNPDLALVNPSPLPGACDALLAARYNGVKNVRKRAMYELIRTKLPLREMSSNVYKPKFFLSDTELLQVLVAREQLQELWRGLLLSTVPAPISEPCRARPGRLSAAERARCALAHCKG